jgi:hypothetical protein
VAQQSGSSSNPTEPRGNRKFELLKATGVAVMVMLAATLVVVALRRYSLSHDQAPNVPVPEPSSQVISTFVAVYTLFLAGFATLAGFVTKGAAPRSWKIVAVEFLVVASALDLIRTVSSTNELYESTTGALTSFTLRDDVDDFIRYFAINAVVVAFAVLTACLRRRSIGASEQT